MRNRGTKTAAPSRLSDLQPTDVVLKAQNEPGCGFISYRLRTVPTRQDPEGSNMELLDRSGLKLGARYGEGESVPRPMRGPLNVPSTRFGPFWRLLLG